MQLVKTGIAGTMESGDILIEITKADQPGIDISLESTVGNQYGRQIKAAIRESVMACGLDGVHVKAVDKGSLDCIIRARVAAAVYRGCECTDYRWE